ncbi:MAG: tRNA (adenosine(37)-N6)-threonylcarbamoyltransferase complex transferase subunit TsaD [Alphaproteobacteria bacterium]
MIILGIETSCDETSVALVTAEKKILAHRVLSQMDHESFGGVVPELAARAHLQALESLCAQTLQDAQIGFDQITAVAATCGPGLIGGLIVGATFGKALAYYHEKPFIPVNHLEGHALTARLTNDLEFPYLLLLVSGGHCQILAVENVGCYKLLGTSLDDAVGETFDKVAKMLELPYPGGPSLEKAAQKGHPDRFLFPRPLTHQNNCSFSFSGLKTAVRYQIEKSMPLDPQDVEDIAASFQKAVADILINRVENAFKMNSHLKTFVMAGGVASNAYIRGKMEDFCQTQNIRFVVPPQNLCTDNGAMIAWAGLEKLRLGYESDLNFSPRPRWPLEELKLGRNSFNV